MSQASSESDDNVECDQFTFPNESCSFKSSSTELLNSSEQPQRHKAMLPFPEHISNRSELDLFQLHVEDQHVVPK